MGHERVIGGSTLRLLRPLRIAVLLSRKEARTSRLVGLLFALAYSHFPSYVFLHFDYSDAGTLNACESVLNDSFSVQRCFVALRVLEVRVGGLARTSLLCGTNFVTFWEQ